MADTAVASGLMPHQKHEHDIWTCKDCGWKYPNAKPSPKIRKHHKKQCPGKAGAEAHAAGGSSDEASDDEHHHHSKGSEAPKQTALDAPVPPVESKSRDFDFSTVSPAENSNGATAPAGEPVVNGGAEEAAIHKDSAPPAGLPVEASKSELMPHQKDEHDVWTCKDCGWKYPNAKPSPKIRKHHKKQCPGKAGAEAHAVGGSSDDASDHEHHHHSKESEAPKQTALDAPVPPMESKSRDFDFSTVSPTENSNGATAPAAEPVVNGGAEEAAIHKDSAPLAALPVEASKSGLMPHQKDEHDVWTCKDCGWKYPNAKPSPKIRKHHKKQCPGKAGAEAHAVGGSSDDASDHEHHQHSKESEAPKQTALDAPVPPVESKSRDFDFSAVSAIEDSNVATAPAAEPAVISSAEEAIHKDSAPPAALPVEASKSGLMPHQKDEHDVWTCKECGWKYPNAKPSPKIRKNHKKHCPGSGGPVAAGGSSDEASDGEHHHGHPVPAQAAPVEPREESGPTAAPAGILSKEIDFASLKESTSPEVTNEENVEVTPTAAVEPDIGTGVADAVPEKAGTPESVAPNAAAASGLMTHQKDEHDIWVCKDCGWKYPNAKPSPKIKKNHKKKCTGKPGGGVETGVSSDDKSDDEHHLSSSTAPVEAPAAAETELPPAAEIQSAVKPGTEDPAAAPEAPGSVSREIDFNALKESSKPDLKSETTALGMAGTTAPVADTETPKEAASVPTGNSGAQTLKEAIRKETDNAEVGAKEKEDPSKAAAVGQAPATDVGGLMPNQKHEGDVWVCKQCGWKFPNAKPSPKVRKNHKKKCPQTGKTAKGMEGGSSEGASDEDALKVQGGKCFPCL